MPDASPVACGVYKPRRPQASPLFRLVSDHLHRLQTVYDERFAREYGPWRPVVAQVAEKFLACEHGFARIRCDARTHEYLLAFSCKCRYFCPSCHAKRLTLWTRCDRACAPSWRGWRWKRSGSRRGELLGRPVTHRRILNGIGTIAAVASPSTTPLPRPRHAPCNTYCYRIADADGDQHTLRPARQHHGRPFHRVRTVRDDGDQPAARLGCRPRSHATRRPCDRCRGRGGGGASVTEPHMTGIGGDMFAIVWLAKEQRLVGGQQPVGSPAPADVRGRPARMSHLPRRDAGRRVHHAGVGDRPDPHPPPTDRVSSVRTHREAEAPPRRQPARERVLLRACSPSQIP